MSATNYEPTIDALISDLLTSAVRGDLAGFEREARRILTELHERIAKLEARPAIAAPPLTDSPGTPTCELSFYEYGVAIGEIEDDAEDQ